MVDFSMILYGLLCMGIGYLVRVGHEQETKKQQEKSFHSRLTWR